MRSRSLRLRLADIRNEIGGIRETVAGIDFDTYRGSWQRTRAVERGVEIISEAVRSLPEELTGRFPDIPWRAIRGIGNELRHAYHHVDDAILWDVATRAITSLEAAIVEMQQGLPETDVDL